MTPKIILKARRKQQDVGTVVRIDDMAQETLLTIMRQTGLTAKYIVSQMIVQGADLIELQEEE